MIDENVRRQNLLLQELSQQVDNIQSVVYLLMIILGAILIFILIIAALKVWNDDKD